MGRAERDESMAVAFGLVTGDLFLNLKPERCGCLLGRMILIVVSS